MSAREASVDGLVVGTGVGTDNVSHWRKVLAAFIAQSSAALAHPYFYTIRTNTKWSLCLLSGLSPTNYSALLLECELVTVRTSQVDGSKSIRLAREKWIDLLNQHGLREVDAEYTDGQINHIATNGECLELFQHVKSFMCRKVFELSPSYLKLSVEPLRIAGLW